MGIYIKTSLIKIYLANSNLFKPFIWIRDPYWILPQLIPGAVISIGYILNAYRSRNYNPVPYKYQRMLPLPDLFTSPTMYLWQNDQGDGFHSNILNSKTGSHQFLKDPAPVISPCADPDPCGGIMREPDLSKKSQSNAFSCGSASGNFSLCESRFWRQI